MLRVFPIYHDFSYPTTSNVLSDKNILSLTNRQYVFFYFLLRLTGLDPRFARCVVLVNLIPMSGVYRLASH